MKEIEATSLEEVARIFGEHPKQKIFASDMPYALRFGWEIKNPELRITIRLANIKQWPQDLLKMCEDEEGRENMRRLLETKAWLSDDGV